MYFPESLPDQTEVAGAPKAGGAVVAVGGTCAVHIIWR